MRFASALLCFALLSAAASSAADTTGDDAKATVVLLHGLIRSPGSMSALAQAVEASGYHVCNIGYPSRSHSVETLAADFVAPAITECVRDRKGPIHFVTHSLGGIIVRQLAATAALPNVGRVVMLSPPNHGSEIVDKLRGLWLFKAVSGPAGQQLGTGSDALPNRLGPAPFELGVITGTRSFNWILSTLIPGADDGKVAVASARLSGMREFLTVPSSHPFIMRNARVIEQAVHFLAHGTFTEARVEAESVDRSYGRFGS